MSQDNYEPIDFGDIDDEFDNTEAQQGSGSDSVPDGEYEMVITGGFASRAQSGGGR